MARDAATRRQLNLVLEPGAILLLLVIELIAALAGQTCTRVDVCAIQRQHAHCKAVNTLFEGVSRHRALIPATSGILRKDGACDIPQGEWGVLSEMSQEG